MFFGFEGTGMQIWGGTSSWGVNDWSNTTSFVWKFYQKSSSPDGLKRYFPGPNAQGSNCDDILNQAKDHYRELKRTFGSAINNQKITIVGYSRGAYMAMCFAKFFELNGHPIYFLGLFDAVSQDLSVEAIISTLKVPMNVETCYHAARSPIIGSRSLTMDRAGQHWENGNKLETRKEFPGSHAAMGGFPNQAGLGDGPNVGFGDPKDQRLFDRRKEITAWWEVGNHISVPAMKKGVLKSSLVDVKPKNWLPESEWYKPTNSTPAFNPAKYAQYGKRPGEY